MYYNPNYGKSTQGSTGQLNLPNFVLAISSATRNFNARIKAWPLKTKVIAGGGYFLLLILIISLSSLSRLGAQASATPLLTSNLASTQDETSTPAAKPRSGPADYPGEVGCDVTWSQTTKEGRGRELESLNPHH